MSKHRTPLAGWIISVTLGILLLATLTVGLVAAVEYSVLPTFTYRFTNGEGHGLIVYSGPRCLPELTRHACESGITQQAFEILRIGPEGSRVVVEIVPEHE